MPYRRFLFKLNYTYPSLFPDFMSIVDISADHPRYFDREERHSVFRVRPPLFRKETYRCPPTVPFGQNGRWNKIIQ